MRRLTIFSALLLASTVVQAQATLTLGERPLQIEQDFGNITDAVRLQNGTIAVVDNGYTNVAFFRPDGQKLASFGRDGQGPNEFRLLLLLGECAPNVLSIYDPNNARITRLAANGTLVSAQQSLSVFARTPYSATCNRLGHTLTINGSAASNGPHAAIDGPYRDSMSVQIDQTTVGLFPGDERWLWLVSKTHATSAPRPGGQRLLVALGSTKLFVAPTDSLRVSVFDLAGQAAGTFARKAPVQRLDDRARTQTIEEEAARRHIPLPVAERMIGRALPAYLPPIERMVADGDTLWVQLARKGGDPSATWWRFDPQGRLLHQLAVPANFHIFRFYGLSALGRWTDADLADSIRAYQLQAKH